MQQRKLHADVHGPQRMNPCYHELDRIRNLYTCILRVFCSKKEEEKSNLQQEAGSKRKLLNVWYQESRCVIQQAAEATTKASFKERGVLWRAVLRQQAHGIITAGLACTETSAISAEWFLERPGSSHSSTINKHVTYVYICRR